MEIGIRPGLQALDSPLGSKRRYTDAYVLVASVRF